MPVCLLCPATNQPSFVEIAKLTHHVSKVHSEKAPPAGKSARQLVPDNRCCICNKGFSTPGGLSDHQKVKRHFPPPSVSLPKPSDSEGPVHSAKISKAPALPAVLNGDTTTRGLDLAEQRVTHSCNHCQASFSCFGDLETHQSSHGKVTCSKCSHIFSSLVEWNDHFKQAHQSTQPVHPQPVSAPKVSLPRKRSPSPAVGRSAPVDNKSGPSKSPDNGFFNCDLCKKTFKSQAGLQTHVSVKHPSRAQCVICQFICSSTATLEEHVDSIHSCSLCKDGILRDAQALSDHMLEHSYPVPCKRCGTRYRTEEERKLHFAAADNDHPVCIDCRLGFEDDNALHEHTNLIHPASPEPVPRRLSAEPVLEARVATQRQRVFECDVCHEAHSSQTGLDVHIVTVHSCPICHDGIYLDTRTLEEHLERHRSPYACHSCGLAYAEEAQLLEHYRDGPNNIHPCCEKCNLAFENNDTYTAHVEEAHPRVVCSVCECYFSDGEELAVHYLSSRKHSKCEKCGIGFRDEFDYTDHGASAHPESHCYLCQWHFDTPAILQNHIKHFFNHPKCQGCNVRFSDADAYQFHLFSVHRPRLDDQGCFDGPAVEADREDKILCDDVSSPLLSSRTFDPVWGFEGSASLPYASFIPLPPSVSGYSSPTSQRVISAGSAGSSALHSRSSTLSVEQRSPTDAQPWNVTVRTLSLDADEGLKASPEFNHTPLSTLPAVGTPLLSNEQAVQSSYFQSPFSPRPEPPSLFTLSQGINAIATPVVENDDAKSDSSGSITRSPPLISPVVKLPDPNVVSPTSTSSSWTMTSNTDSRRSTPHPHSPHSTTSSKEANGSLSVGQTTTPGHAVPQLSLLVPSSTHLTGSARWCASGYPSSISPESAGISVSASMTPEYLREARAYLSLTQQAQEPQPPPSPPMPRSPGNASPILSSTGLALGGRGRRREVRFEDNILSDPAWDRQSTSSDSSLDPPVALPRPGSNLRTNGISKLPRYSALKRPARKWTNGQARVMYNRRVNGTPPPSYHCRSCYKDHCDEPTTTTCGHLFCYECISTAIMRDSRCPVCEAPTLLYCLFRIDTSA